MEAQITDTTKALSFLLAGKAIVTFKNRLTGGRYTYKIKKDKEKKVFYVQLLTGPDNTADYQYIGLITEAGNFTLTKASRLPITSLPVLGFSKIFSSLVNGNPNENLEIWHSGICGRCSKLLTDPESIESGLGPICRAKKQ